MNHSANIENDAASCMSCAMRRLCLPAGLSAPGVPELDDIVTRSGRLKKAEVLYRQGDECRSVYAVMEGGVKTTIVNRDGARQITGFYMPGEMFGFGGLADSIHSRQAETLQESVVCELPLHHLDALSQTNAELPVAMRSMIGFELRREQDQVVLLGKLSAEQKLAAFVLDISSRVASRQQDGLDFDMLMTRQDMANYLGLAVETLSRLFHQFEDQGLLETSRRHVSILNLKQLERMAGDFVATAIESR